MKKIYAFIEKANQYLLFGTLILIFSVMSWELIIKDLFRSDYQDPMVEVIDSTSETDTKRTIKYYKEYHQYIRDTHIVRIKSDAIDVSESKKSRSMGFAMSDSYEKSSNSGTVNLLFIKASESSRLLFKQDVFISYFTDIDIDEDEVSDKLVLHVVSDDTDGDGFLSDSDREDLYISNYDGTDLTLIKKGFYNHRFLKGSLLMVHVETSDDDQFFEYNISTGVLTKLDISVPSSQ